MMEPEQNRYKNTYFRDIGVATKTLLEGLRLTWRHFLESRQLRKPLGIANDKYFEQQTGIVTVQYPKESLPVPDIARYRLHNEIDDCIVCDKCAKICPVDCIEIEPIKAVEPIGQTSDGTSKRIYAARFDIDMAKCCFCGLCTTVCPTECLTMTKVYDFSEFDVVDHTYAFAEMSPLEILQKRRELEDHQAQKAAAKPAAAAAGAKPAMARPGAARPGVARPMAPKPAASAEDPQETARRLMEQKQAAAGASAVEASSAAEAAHQPNPTATPAPTPQGTENSPAPGANKPTFRPRPAVPKPAVPKPAPGNSETRAAEAKFEDKPTTASAQQTAITRPAGEGTAPAADAESGETTKAAAPKPRPVMKPLIKKAAPVPEAGNSEAKASSENTATSAPKPRLMTKPAIKKAAPEAKAAEAAPHETTSSTEQLPPVESTPKTENPAGEGPTPASARPRPVVKPVLRKTTAAPEVPPLTEGGEVPAQAPPVSGQGSALPEQVAPHTASPKPAAAKARPVIKPKIPNQTAMQEDPSKQKREDTERQIKPPVEVVEKKDVSRKPAQEDKTEEEKRQDDSQRPNPPGMPD